MVAFRVDGHIHVYRQVTVLSVVVRIRSKSLLHIPTHTSMQYVSINKLGDCTALWGERERGREWCAPHRK